MNEPATSKLPLRWRPLEPGDVDAWLELLTAIEKVEARGELSDVEELRDEFAPSWVRPELDSRAAFDEHDDMVAFGWVKYRPQPTRARRIRLWGDVRPDWRRRGVGAALLDWLEARGAAIATTLDQQLPGMLEVEAEARQADRVALLSSRGYAPTRHFFEMRRDLSEPMPEMPLEDGLVMHRFDERFDQRVNLVHNEAFTDHWGSEPLSPEQWRLWITGSHNFRADLSRVVTHGDEVTGYALAFVFPQDAALRGYTEAWIGTLGTARVWRRRGIASALLAESLRVFADAGLEYGALGVDTENPTGALRLYHRAGFREIRQRTDYTKPPP